MNLEELRAALAALLQERAGIYAAAEARFEDPDDATEVRGPFVLDDDGNETSERDEHAGQTDEEVGRLGEIEREEATLTTRIERLERAAKAAEAGRVTDGYRADVTLDTTNTDDAFNYERTRTATPSQVRAQAATAIERMAGVTDEVRESIEARAQELRHGLVDRLIIATGSDAYRDYFRSMVTADNEAQAVMRAAANPEWVRASAQVDELRAALALTSGYVLPVTVDPGFVRTGDVDTNPIRALASRRTVVTNTHEVNSLSGVSWSFDAEGSEVSEDTPTAGNETVTAHMARGYVEYTIETGQDIANLESELIGLLAEGADNLEATKFMLGSGTNEPWGIIPAMAASAVSNVTTATTTKVEEADLYAIMANLQVRHRGRAVWLAALETYNVLRQLESSGGSRIWSGSLANGLPADLVNKAHYESSVMDTVTTLPDTFTVGDDVMVFGNLEAGYRIADRVGMSIEPLGLVIDTTSNRPNGKRALFAHYRVGGNVINPNAIRVLEVG